MDETAKNRKDNLMQLAAAIGNLSELARIAGIGLSSVQGIKYGRPDKFGNPRAMGDKMALKIEAAFGLDAGSMSNQHGPDWAAAAVANRHPENPQGEARTVSASIPQGEAQIASEPPQGAGNRAMADELRGEARKLIEQGTRLLAFADKLAG